MEQSVFFDNHEGEKLAGTLHLPDKPSVQGLVFGHCFTCSRHTRILIRICQELAKAGCMALRFDFSGNGQSEGIFTETTYSKHIGEMKTAVSFLREKGVSQIGLAGHSVGAAIAVLTAAETDGIRAVCGMAGHLTGLAPPVCSPLLSRTSLSAPDRSRSRAEAALCNFPNAFSLTQASMICPDASDP